MLYIVGCDITKRYYMQGDFDVCKAVHLVEAENSTEAEEKLRKKYSGEDSEYSVCHYVDIEYINEIIL